MRIRQSHIHIIKSIEITLNFSKKKYHKALMSKSTLKKYLQSLTKEQLIETVLEIYDNLKPAKEYLEYYLSPDEKAMFEKYKKVINEEVYPTKKRFNSK